jgi:beta-glucoside operon transcriptional antiterminator
MTNIKKYNNNVILADDGGQEVIVLGKGLGFNATPGAAVNEALVEKVFVPQTTFQINHFSNLLSDLPYEYIILASKIVDYAKTQLTQPLNQSVIIALADHLSFAVKRLRDRLDMPIPLFYDIRHLYVPEFTVGEAALDIIRRETGADFPIQEAATIALHFINAESETQEMPITMETTNIIKNIILIIEQYFHFIFDEGSFEFTELITFLRNTLLRYLQKKPADPAPDDGLYALLQERYPRASVCTERINAYMQNARGQAFSLYDRAMLLLCLKYVAENAGVDLKRDAKK